MTIDTTEIRQALQGMNEAMNGRVGEIPIPLRSWTLEDGTVMSAFSNGASPIPGFDYTEAKAPFIRWNNHATPDPVKSKLDLPLDLDATKPVYLKALVSKVGATVGDATTLTFAVYFQEVGALHDADSNAGGASDAVDGDATSKTVQVLSRAIAHGDVPAAPCSATVTMQPTDGTLGTDDFCVHKTWGEYTRVPVVTVA